MATRTSLIRCRGDIGRGMPRLYGGSAKIGGRGMPRPYGGFGSHVVAGHVRPDTYKIAWTASLSRYVPKVAGVSVQLVVDEMQSFFQVFPRFAFRVLIVLAHQVRGMIRDHEGNIPPFVPVPAQPGDALLSAE